MLISAYAAKSRVQTIPGVGRLVRNPSSYFNFVPVSVPYLIFECYFSPYSFLCNLKIIRTRLLTCTQFSEILRLRILPYPDFFSVAVPVPVVLTISSYQYGHEVIKSGLLQSRQIINSHKAHKPFRKGT